MYVRERGVKFPTQFEYFPNPEQSQSKKTSKNLDIVQKKPPIQNKPEKKAEKPQQTPQQ